MSAVKTAGMLCRMTKQIRTLEELRDYAAERRSRGEEDGIGEEIFAHAQVLSSHWRRQLKAKRRIQGQLGGNLTRGKAEKMGAILRGSLAYNIEEVQACLRVLRSLSRVLERVDGVRITIWDKTPGAGRIVREEL